MAVDKCMCGIEIEIQRCHDIRGCGGMSPALGRSFFIRTEPKLIISQFLKPLYFYYESFYC